MSEVSVNERNYQQQNDVFPHVRDKIQQLVSTSNPQTLSNEHHSEQVSEFRKRFPWLAFTKTQKQIDNQSKYTYMGRDTEKSEPFYVSFDVKNTGVNKKDKQMLFQQMEMMIGATVEADTQRWNNLVKENRDKIQRQCENEDVIGRAYLLIGLAKPSTTINQIYDSLFYQIQSQPSNKPAQTDVENESSQSIESRSNSKMQSSISDAHSQHSIVDLEPNDQGLLAYKKIRKSWQSKRKSYEFYKLICRAYLQYEEYFNNQKKGELQKTSAIQQKIWLKKMIGDQLFSQTQGRRVHLRNYVTMQNCVIEDQEYYHYFMTLFQNHARQILDQIDQFQKKGGGTRLEIKLQNSEIKKIQLEKYDYRSFAINLCKGVNLSEESLTNMVEYHRNNHNIMLSQISFKTKQQRLQHIANLQHCSNEAFRIKLVPLVQMQSDKTTKQSYTSIDNYLIVLQRAARIFSTKVSKQFTLDKMINENNNNTVQIQPKFINQHLFQYIYYFKQMSNANTNKVDLNVYTSLIEKFSFNPKHIALEYKKNGRKNMEKYPKFEKALEEYIGIDSLPMSYEQQMLGMTPTQDIDLHEYIQQLYKDLIKIDRQQNINYRIQQLKQKCARLSNSQIAFSVNKEEFKKWPYILKGRVMEEEEVRKSYLQIIDRVNEKNKDMSINLGSIMQSEDELSNIIFSDEKSIELVELILKSVSKVELIKLLMLSMFCYQLNHKDRHIFYKLKQEEDYLQTGRDGYKIWSQPDQQKMYQYAMILLCATKVVGCVKFTFRTREDQPQSYKGHRQQHKMIIKSIIMGYLSTLIEYFYYLLRIISAEPNQRHSLIKMQSNREQGALDSLFKVYDQLMSDSHGNEIKALIKVGLMNTLQKERLQLVKKLINTEKYLKNMQKYCVNSTEDSMFMSFGQIDYDEKNFMTLYQEIQKKYLKINELYFANNLRKYQEVRLQCKELINGEEIPEKLKTYLKTAESKAKNIEEFFKNSRTSQRSLEDIKLVYLKLIRYKQSEKQQKEKDKTQIDKYYKSQLELELLNKLAEFALFNKKYEIKSKKEQLDPMIDQQCREIEQVQILLFDLIYAKCYLRRKGAVRLRTELQEEYNNQMKLKLLMLFLYCKPKYNKNQIERLYLKPSTAQNYYQLIRTMSLMVKCNIDLRQSQQKIQA